MLYWLSTLKIAHADMREFLDILGNQIVPVADRHGMKLIGSWQAIVGNMEEITDIWAFEDMEHFSRAIGSLAKDPDVQAALERVRCLVQNENTKLLLPVPFSPLK